ncbi:hypothetical protein HRR78_004805 [Exophiala dermatitidis]|nr:hypothetical protein HRR75_000273 [Exophiala dermatitidis]KAJ4549994.1 hypothetical protein HRR78_004805 [Exophiala dermatitidis]
MASTHLWPAGGIIATLFSPFGPAMGARLVRWVRWIFGDEGTPPGQREVVPEGGQETEGRIAQLTEDVSRQRVQIQHLTAENERLRNEVRTLQASTYTITGTITRHVG